MPRCRECGDEHRSYKALETHWKQTHQQKYSENYSNSRNENQLAATNLIQYWKKQVNASASPLQHS